MALAVASSDASSGPVASFFRSFSDLRHCPRGLWFVIFAFAVEAIGYFGMLTLMSIFLTEDLGWSDVQASITISTFTMLVTFLMLGLGSYAEKFGLRRAIGFALLTSTIARVLYTSSGDLLGGAPLAVLVLVSLLLVAIGSAILQPVCYSGVKQYTDKKTNSIAYGLLYGFMNLGIVIAGGFSAWVRPGVDRLLGPESADSPAGALDSLLAPLTAISSSGVQAMNWVATAVTGVAFLGFFLMMTPKAEANKLRPDTAEQDRDSDERSVPEKVRAYFTDGPFSNGRFVFFIFMLLPVRTLFAHQWLTMPLYITRAYPDGVADHMEWLVNWINPLIIFLFVPVLTALTRKVNVYTLMMVGSLISALPTFLLAFGPNLYLLIAYFVIFSLGEALWSARFLEYASELAPDGQIAQYMGLANIPWLAAKFITGLYAGAMLAKFCPPDTPPEELSTGTMWLIYAFIAMSSPIGLWLARNWVREGLNPSEPAGAEA